MDTKTPYGYKSKYKTSEIFLFLWAVIASSLFIYFLISSNNSLNPLVKNGFVPADSDLEQLLNEGYYNRCFINTGIGVKLSGIRVAEVPQTYPAKDIIDLGSEILNPNVIYGTAGIPVKVKWKTPKGEVKEHIFKRVIEKKCYKN